MNVTDSYQGHDLIQQAAELYSGRRRNQLCWKREDEIADFRPQEYSRRQLIREATSYALT
jgi:hypothetical protein